MRTELIVVAGFLESGKTKLINSIKDTIGDDSLPVAILCERGFTELRDAFEDVVYINDPREISTAFFNDLMKKFPNRKFIMEYNGTWALSHLFSMALPKYMIIEKVIYTLNYQSHEQYLTNMSTLLLEQINYCNSMVLTGIEDITVFKGRAYELVNQLKPSIKIYTFDEYDIAKDFKRKNSKNYVGTFLWLLFTIIVVFIFKNYII